LRILDKYIYKELYATFFAVLAVLLLITFGTETARLLAEAVKSEIPSSVVFQVILYKIPPALEIILPLVAMLSVMLAIGRLYQDQEMVVLRSCGVADSYFQKRVFWFLLPLAILTAWITLYVTPWSLQQEREVISKAQMTSPLAALSAGKFNELPSGKGVFFAKEIRQDKTMAGIWLQLNQQENDMTLIAPTGKFEWVGEKLVLVLFNGISYQGLDRGDSLSVKKFQRFEAFLPEVQMKPPSRSKKEYSSIELWQSDDIKQQVLLQWRVMIPFSILVLGLLALKLSKSKPREGRFAKLFIALVVYVVFSQLLVVNKDLLIDEKVPLFISLWVVPLLFMLYALKRSAR